MGKIIGGIFVVAGILLYLGILQPIIYAQCISISSQGGIFAALTASFSCAFINLVLGGQGSWTAIIIFLLGLYELLRK